ncbi:hypothetical protein ACFJGX_07220 [Hydrogenophaga sp. UC242_50]|uniref:hypothetical protein n=1 Tax=Hydrogenophaga sp. UC242_50 TaxID=3350169 RepID=UPI0036D217E2
MQTFIGHAAARARRGHGLALSGQHVLHLLALRGRHAGHLLLHLRHGLVHLGTATDLLGHFPQAGFDALGVRGGGGQRDAQQQGGDGGVVHGGSHG